MNYIPLELKMKEIQKKFELVDKMSKNGITPFDMKEATDKAYKDGFQEGYCESNKQTIKMIYAAICIALKEKHEFGKKRCLDILRLVDEKVIYAFDSEEAVDEVFDKLGITINFDESIERIEEKQDGCDKND